MLSQIGINIMKIFDLTRGSYKDDYIYSFENNITIAKKDGRYGAIDMNNKEVIPFNLPYVDVRGFRDGRASVKDDADQWGVINTKGELIVPCENDTIIL